jgi:predicted outer membrane repeat protein
LRPQPDLLAFLGKSVSLIFFLILHPQSFSVVIIDMTRLFIFLCSIYLCLSQVAFVTVIASGQGRTIRIPKDYSSIQEGIEKAVDGDTILVAPGTYHENIDFLGRKLVLASRFILKGDTTIISKTILDGGRPDNKDSGSVVRFVSGEDSSSVIIGFTIQNGSGTLILDTRGYGGGGILCLSSSPMIIQNIIKDNSAYAYGGGIYCQEGSPQIVQNQIINNETSYFGGGIFCNKASPRIEENTLQYNSAKYGRGGGIHCYSDTALIKRNLILNNSCYIEGGGVCCESSSVALIVNNTLVMNKAAGGSGIACIKSSSPVIVNNIIAFSQGPPLWCDERSEALVTRNDFWKNPGENYGNCKPGDDNLFVDPLFVNMMGGDHHLQEGSPVIDAGDTTLVKNDPDGSKPDLGAFYFHK